MQIGCVRVTERALLGDPPTAEQLADARTMIDGGIEGAVAALPNLGAPSAGRIVVGLAGTVSTLSMIDIGLAQYDEAKVHHHWLSLDAIHGWRDALAAETVEAHRRRPGMVPGREDVILGGICILAAVLERLGVDGCLSSEHDILDGLARSVLRP
jgi:exopolyphosphatase/guanosine-5'-triphosphate,3'-diphosphate pyrophosphatase